MSIYISSACIKESDLGTNLRSLFDLGFDNVELTGGINFEEDVKPAILNFLSLGNTNFQFHNYSPCPKEEFVLNLASQHKETFETSKAHVKDTLSLTRELKLAKYAVHAGFYIPVNASELGKTIKRRELFDKEISKQLFVETISELYQEFPEELYVENNVVSQSNFQEYNQNPFMLTCSEEYFELKREIKEFKLLLDLAHLKVSCQTLGLDFYEEAHILCQETDYIHISDNDGSADTNKGVNATSSMAKLLQELPLKSKTITLEVYSGIEDLMNTYRLVQELN